jgi:hypothetical protein
MENINISQIEEFLKLYTSTHPYIFKDEIERNICIEHLALHQYLLNTYLLDNTRLVKQKFNDEFKIKCKTNEVIDKLNLIHLEFKIYLDEIIANERYTKFKDYYSITKS